MDKKPNTSQDIEVRKGPWTMEEDLILINYIANHGEGVWNSLARSAGLKRTGKSCRLRWLNYLRPDVRRGNISPEEELLIMELHAKWGNRWSKIAKHLPGRTDNEIKNYWRTRIQKHLKRGDQMMMSSSSNCSQMSLTDDQQATSSRQITAASYGGASDNNDHAHPYLPTMSPASSYPAHHQAFQLEASGYIINNNNPPHLHHQETCNDNFWGAPDEDIWSMQLFNGD